MVQNSYLINACYIRFFFTGRWKQYAKTHHFFYLSYMKLLIVYAGGI
jgi:hypothetical protein